MGYRRAQIAHSLLFHFAGYGPSPLSSRRISSGTSRRGVEEDSYEANNSILDHGANQFADSSDDYSRDRGRPSSSRISLGDRSPGHNVGRASGARSDFDISRSRYGAAANDSYDDAGLDDYGAGEAPSFNMDDVQSHSDDDQVDENDAYRYRGGLTVNSDDEDAAEAIEAEASLVEQALEDTGAGRVERKAAKPNKKEKQTSDKKSKKKKNGLHVDDFVAARQRGISVDIQDKEVHEIFSPSGRDRIGMEFDGNVRRSTRQRYTPLEWWRGERAVYVPPARGGGPSRRRRVRDSADGEDGDEADEQDPDDTIDADAFEDAPIKSYAAPVLQEVIRIRRDPGEGTFSGMRIGKASVKKQGGPKAVVRRVKRRGGDDEEDDVIEYEPDPTQPTRQPEDGWDAETEPHGTVWDVETEQEVERRIACPISQVRPKTAINSPFAFEKVFGVDAYMAAGILEIPIGGSKPTKPTKDNNYTFVVMEGAVDVRVHRTMFRVGPMGMFMVPKGNTYSIENCCQRKARIFFAQARQSQVQAPVPSAAADTTTTGDDSTMTILQPGPNINARGDGSGSSSADEKKRGGVGGKRGGKAKR